MSDSEDSELDFEPAPLAIAPDGGIAPDLQPTKESRPPPRLCEAGPCVNYHRFVVQLDAESPKAESIEPGGKMVGMPPRAPFYVRVHHYCYPAVGVETELGSTPVVQCNRWAPKSAGIYDVINTPAGQEYQAAFATWQNEQDAAASEAPAEDPIRAWVTMHMREGDELAIRPDSPRNVSALVEDVAVARERITESYLAGLGAGSYKLVLTRPDRDIGTGRVVATKIIEVP